MSALRRTAWPAVLAACLAASPALAADNRIVTREFRQNEVVRVDGKVGVQATIGFGEGEKIENVAVGDADKWQITPNKRADLLFVKPLEPAARTNMTVVTDKRTYFFDLVASPTGTPVYMLSFTYGSPAAAAPAITSADPPRPSFTDLMREALVDSPAGQGVDPAMLNFSWAPKGPGRLVPLRIYDDGANVYLLWGAKQATPEIRVRNAKGEDAPARLGKRGNTVVVEGVPHAIVLTDGKAIAVLENRNLPPAAESAAPASPPASVPLPGTAVATAVELPAAPVASPKAN